MASGTVGSRDGPTVTGASIPLLMRQLAPLIPTRYRRGSYRVGHGLLKARMNAWLAVLDAPDME
jgi:hypothetical protein